MTKQEHIFNNLKSLRTIASIEALGSNTDFMNDILWKQLSTNKPPFSHIGEKLDLNLMTIIQFYRIKLLLKDAEIAFLMRKIEDENEINSNATQLTNVNGVMNDIKMAISSAKKDILENKNQELKEISSPNKSKNSFSEIKLSNEIKQYIEHNLNQILEQNLHKIVGEILNLKKEKKSKVLDLSEVEVTSKITPKK